MLAAGALPAVGAFDTISDTGREALSQLDRALGVLSGDGPVRAPQPGLDQLRELVDRARSTGLAAELTETGSPRPVPADVGAAVYRLVQEAVTNTVKHADASRVSLTLAWRATTLAVTVQDDGRGPGGIADIGGRGLIGMRERTHAFGGELTTGAGPGGRGFQVGVVLSLDAVPGPVDGQGPGE